MATNFDPIATTEIAVFADVDAVTFGRLKNRDDHLQEIVSAAAGAPKIPAQAIANQTSGNGLGLEVSQFNHVRQTIVVGPIAADGTTDTVTAIPASLDTAILFGVSVAVNAAGLAIYSVEPLWKSTSAFVWVRVIREAGGAGTQTLTIDVYAVTF